MRPKVIEARRWSLGLYVIVCGRWDTGFRRFIGFSTKELGYQGTLMEKGYAYMVLSIAIEVLGYKVWDFGHRLVYAYIYSVYVDVSYIHMHVKVYTYVYRYIHIILYICVSLLVPKRGLSYYLWLYITIGYY